jgi:uncharacterized protein (DUF2141 family)
MWVAALVALAAPAYADEAAKTGTMVVTAHSFKNDGGQAVVAIYRRGENWLEPKKAFRLMTVPIKDGKVTLTLKDMPYDTYAISVAHDSNKNGKMDMRWLPYPKPEEGGGVSNNFVRSGKPEYDKAKFDFAKALMSVRITIVYQ